MSEYRRGSSEMKGLFLYVDIGLESLGDILRRKLRNVHHLRFVLFVEVFHPIGHHGHTERTGGGDHSWLV